MKRRDFFLLTLLLLLILAVAAGVRFYNLGSQSLWSDEGNSAALATRSLAQIAQDTANDIHPPFYYWLLRFWTGIFGASEVGLRSLSAVLGVLLVLAIAELGRRLYGEATGLAAAFIAALAPFQMYYSQETRMYVLVALLATASFLHFWWFLEHEDRGLTARTAARSEWRWMPSGAAPLVAIWVIGLYTHYAFPLVIGLLTLLYVVWAWNTRARGLLGKRLLRWGVLLGLTLALFLPWVPVAVRQVMAWPTGGATASPRTVLETSLGILSFGPAARLISSPWQTWALVTLALCGAVPWRFVLSPFVLARRGRGAVADTSGVMAELPAGKALAMAALPLAPLAGASVLPRPINGIGLAGGVAVAPPIARGIHMPGSDLPERARGGAWYWVRWLTPLLWVLGPVAMMAGLGLYRDAYLKFLLIASPAFTLLLARGAIAPARALSLYGTLREHNGETPLLSIHDLLGFFWGLITLTLIAAVSLPALSSYYTNPRVARDDYRGIAQFIQATAQPGDAVLLDAPGQSEVFGYYFHKSMPVYPLPRQRPIDPAQTLDELGNLAAYNKIYVLYWAAAEADPNRVIEGWLDRSGYKMLDQWHGNVRLAVYVMPERRPPDQTADNLNYQLGNQIALLGYRAWNLAPHAGEVTQLQLQWQARQTPTRRYKVFLQLLDPRDQVIAQRDAEPAGESQPTTQWQPGKVIQDNHGLLIPPGTPPGTYRRIIGLYDMETLERLRLPGGEDHIDLPPLTVERSAEPPALDALGMQNNQSFDFGGMKLLGYDQYKRGFKHAPDTPINPGDRVHMSFYWQANVQPRADWWFDMTLTDGAGRIVAELQAPLVGPTYSTTLWEAHEIVRGEHDLQLPGNLSPDTYRLSLTLLPDTNTPAGVAYLGTVRVERPAK